MARPVETSGFRLLSGEAIAAPSRWMAMKRRKRPATVPMIPASTKNTMPRVVVRPIPPVSSTAVHRPTAPTATLSQNPA